MLETRRAKECQRGIAGAAERAKEGGRVPSESSDTRLGSRDRAFESPHSDQFSQKNRLIDGFSLFSAQIGTHCIMEIPPAEIYGFQQMGFFHLLLLSYVRFTILKS